MYESKSIIQSKYSFEVQQLTYNALQRLDQSRRPYLHAAMQRCNYFALLHASRVYGADLNALGHCTLVAVLRMSVYSEWYFWTHTWGGDFLWFMVIVHAIIIVAPN